MTHTRQAVSQSKMPLIIALAAVALAALTETEPTTWAEGFASCWSAVQPLIDQLPPPADAGSAPLEN